MFFNFEQKIGVMQIANIKNIVKYIQQTSETQKAAQLRETFKSYETVKSILFLHLQIAFWIGINWEKVIQKCSDRIQTGEL